jgi:osmotically-inducible protein OsmY
VDVQVHEGVVTLTGKVQRRSLAQEIVRLTSAVDGVVGVPRHSACRGRRRRRC